MTDMKNAHLRKTLKSYYDVSLDSKIVTIFTVVLTFYSFIVFSD